MDNIFDLKQISNSITSHFLVKIILGLTGIIFGKTILDRLKDKGYWIPRKKRIKGATTCFCLDAKNMVFDFDRELREREWNVLDEFCKTGKTLDDQSPKEQVSIKLFTGSGGSGKSRLMIEWALHKQRQRWHTPFLHKNITETQIDQLLKIQKHLFVVIDYAEARNDLTDKLKKFIESPSRRHLVRIVLVARNSGDWWTDVIKNFDIKKHIQSSVEELSNTSIDRIKVFDNAIVACKKWLSAERMNDDVYCHNKSLLVQNDFDRILFIYMAAYATVVGYKITSNKILNEILILEQNPWKYFFPKYPNDHYHTGTEFVSVISRVMAAVTPLGGVERRRLDELIPKIKGPDMKQLPRIFKFLRNLYRPTESNKYLGTIEPDLLGEQIVLDTLLDLQRCGGDPMNDLDFLESAFGDATQDEIKDILIVLGRISLRDNLEENEKIAVENWMRFFVDKDRGIKNADAAVKATLALGKRMVAFPLADYLTESLNDVTGPKAVDLAQNVIRPVLKEENISLRPASLQRLKKWVYKTLVNSPLYSDQTPDDRESGKLRVQYALALADLGELKKSLREIKKAIKIFENSDKTDPRHLALSYMILGERQNDLGGHQAALASAEKADELYRSFNDKKEKKNLARCLDFLGSTHSTLGNRSKGFEKISEAKTIFEDLESRHENAQDAGYAKTLINYSFALAADPSLWKNGDCPEKVAEKAAKLWKKLADSCPDAFKEGWARSLKNYAVCLNRLNKSDEALKNIEQSVGVYESLVKTSEEIRKRALPDLADAYMIYADIQAQRGNHGDALKKSKSAVEMFEKLMADTPDRFKRNHAKSLMNYGEILSRSKNEENSYERIIQIFSAMEDAKRIFEELKKGDGISFHLDYARCYLTLGKYHLEMGDVDKAKEEAEAAKNAYVAYNAPKSDIEKCNELLHDIELRDQTTSSTSTGT